MEEKSYRELTNEIIEKWKDQGVGINGGVTENELTSFERKYGVKLPEDFRYFYSVVNGMIDWEMDNYCFSLWSLDRIIERLEEMVIKQRASSSKVQIAFGDFLIDSHRYYLVIEQAGNSYIETQAEPSKPLTNTFTDFLKQYLIDPNLIYLWGQ